MIVITISDQIKIACVHANMTQTEVAKKIGMSPQSFYNRTKTGKFTKSELQSIGDALGAEYVSFFKFPDGEEI